MEEGWFHFFKLVTLNRPDLDKSVNKLTYLYRLPQQMPSLWETVGYMTTSLAVLNSLGFFFLKNQGTNFVERNLRLDYLSKLILNPQRRSLAFGCLIGFKNMGRHLS